MNDTREQELREINARLAVVVPLWTGKHTQASAFEKHAQANQQLEAAGNDEVFISTGGGTRAIGPARVACLFDCIEAIELRLAMSRKEPKQEVEALLRRKHELLESMLTC